VGAGIVDLIVACGLKRRGFFSKECCFRERDNITATCNGRNSGAPLGDFS
jgi:hypothetical protein